MWNPTRSYNATASSFAAVTVRLAERQPISRNVVSDCRSSAWPIPVPRTDGETQICVMWPHSGATRLASEMPHSLPLHAFERRERRRPVERAAARILHDVVQKPPRARALVRYWSLIRLSTWPAYAAAINCAAASW